MGDGGSARGTALMNDQDVELSRREAELTQDEATLHAELTRAMAATTDVERRLKQLKTSVAEAEVAGIKDSQVFERVLRHALPALDAEGALAGARAARAQALTLRTQANAEVRSRIVAFRASLQQLQQTLGVDEKALQRVVQQARQSPPEPPREVSTAAILVSGAPPPGLRAKAPAPAPVGPPVPPAPPPVANAPASKRQSPRVRMQAAVDFESDDNFFNGFSANISDGGLFIATVNVLPLGTQVDMGFSLPTGERVECKGVVRWVREVNDQQPDVFPGIGVQFADLDPRAQQAIEQFIQQRDPMFYVD